jgi:hypothetical protein
VNCLSDVSHDEQSLRDQATLSAAASTTIDVVTHSIYWRGIVLATCCSMTQVTSTQDDEAATAKGSITADVNGWR